MYRMLGNKIHSVLVFKVDGDILLLVKFLPVRIV
jgi:hypothetical protein